MSDASSRLVRFRHPHLLPLVLLAAVVLVVSIVVLLRSRPDGPCRPGPAPQSTRSRVAQLVVVGVADEGGARRVLAGSSPVGGILLLQSESSWYEGGVLRRLVRKGHPPPLIAVDEEGGSVQRLAPQAGRIPAARAVAMSMTPEQAERLARSHAERLRRLGVTTVLAPVADLYDPNNPTIGDRSFSADPALVAQYSSATARGIREAGLMPVLKHFPGGGRASADPHRSPAQTPELPSLRGSDLIPFEGTSSSEAAVMVGHLDVPGLTEPGRPASLSERAIGGLLRGELGFDGLVLTDDLSAMAAITSRFSLESAMTSAIRAGADIGILSVIDQDRLDGLLDDLSRQVDGDAALRASVAASLERASRARAAYGICAA